VSSGRDDTSSHGLIDDGFPAGVTDRFLDHASIRRAGSGVSEQPQVFAVVPAPRHSHTNSMHLRANDKRRESEIERRRRVNGN